jgi:hypothetical protein
VLDVVARLMRRFGATVMLQEDVASTLEGGRSDDLPEDLRTAVDVMDFCGAATATVPNHIGACTSGGPHELVQDHVADTDSVRPADQLQL